MGGFCTQFSWENAIFMKNHLTAIKLIKNLPKTSFIAHWNKFHFNFHIFRVPFYCIPFIFLWMQHRLCCYNIIEYDDGWLAGWLGYWKRQCGIHETYPIKLFLQRISSWKHFNKYPSSATARSVFLFKVSLQTHTHTHT